MLLNRCGLLASYLFIIPELFLLDPHAAFKPIVK